MGARRRWLTIGVIVLVSLIGLIFTGYWFNWDWTGFTQHTGSQVQQYQPTKTLWDWLQLLIIPLVLAVAALLFNRANTRTEQQIAAQRYQQDQQIAIDKQREDLLQAYLDRMSELLLKEKLRSSVEDAEVRNVARVRTITILFQLDARRIEYVFAFLREAGLMSTQPNRSIVSLSQASFSKINLSHANLREANFSGADLYRADLSHTNLYGANFSGADLYGANFSGASLSEADLSGASLIEADLSNAYLREANFSGADLRGADLSKTDLIEADLSKTDLSGADLSRANLSGADLSRADLSGATVTEEQLNKAKSLDLATMPDESKHP